MSESGEEYARRYESLSRMARRLESMIADDLTGMSHIDRISARAKSPGSFVAKAVLLLENGQPKYSHPLTEVQDQIGARVIVFYPSSVQPVADVLSRYFNPIEEQQLVPESDWAFGYFGRHFVFALPKDVIGRDDNPEFAPPFFELQVKTLFQHAWSEATHDLGYKPAAPLAAEHARCFAYAAAQAWGADRMLEELRQNLS